MPPGATRTNEIVARLGQSSTEIGSVVKLITSMSRNVSDAAAGAATIDGVAQAANSTATGATQTQATAQDLARMAAELQSTVAAYRV